MDKKQPHILILMPDQQRADSMGCAGHPIIQTPNMDKLAKEGVRFTHAYTVSPICMSARASFISGLYPHNHGMWTNAGQLPADDETFFHHLKQLGYFTAHVGKSHYYPHGGKHLRKYEEYMHARGIDYVHETTGPWATVSTDSYMTDHWQELGLLEAFREDYVKRRNNGPLSVWPSPLPAEDYLDSYIGNQAVEFVDSYQDDKPMCLFVGFGGPHEPWDAPGDYATMYRPSDTPLHIPPASFGDWMSQEAIKRMEQGRIENITEEDIQKIRANYYGKISLVDYWFGEILGAFDRKGWLDNTLVVFWSDHGEMAGDHQRLHKSVFYESSVRVPLIIRWPGHIEGGKISDTLVENIDVYPSLLEAVGAEQSQRCLGKSLWPVLRNPDTQHRDAVFSEIDSQGHRNIMVRTNRYKYALDETGQGYLLYDLIEDPQEQNNLIGKNDMKQVEMELRDRTLCFLVQAQCRM